MSGRPDVNLFFRLAAASAALFVLTVLAMSASMLSDPQAPPARFLNQHGGTLIAWEVGVTLLLGFLAMAVDRRRTLRELRRTREQNASATPSHATTD